MFRLDGKIALVTGRLARHRPRVLRGPRRAGRDGRRQLRQGRSRGARGGRRHRRARAERPTSPASTSPTRKAVDAAVDAIVKRHGKLDILVANAGISIDGLLLRLKDEDLDKLFATNVRGAIACARACSHEHDARALGPHRLHVERRRRDGQRRADGLRRDQGRAHRRRQVDRARVRVAQRHRQRRRARATSTPT